MCLLVAISYPLYSSLLMVDWWQASAKSIIMLEHEAEIVTVSYPDPVTSGTNQNCDVSGIMTSWFCISCKVTNKESAS